MIAWVHVMLHFIKYGISNAFQDLAILERHSICNMAIVAGASSLFQYCRFQYVSIVLTSRGRHKANMSRDISDRGARSFILGSERCSGLVRAKNEIITCPLEYFN